MIKIPNINMVGAFFGLLDCPFCGGEPHMIGDSDNGYSVYCAECNEGGHTEVGWFFTVTEAISAWNTRHVETCRITASSTDGLCSDNPRHYFELSCGHSFTLDGLEPPNYCEVCGAKVEVD